LTSTYKSFKNKKTGHFLIGSPAPTGFSLSKSPSGKLWYAGLGALISYDPLNERGAAHFGMGIVDPRDFRISENPKENIVLRKQILDQLDQKLKDYGTAHLDITYCFVGSDGVIWSLHGGGKSIFQYDPVKKEFIPQKIILEEDLSNSMQMLFEDSSGILWFGTSGKGLIKRIPLSQPGSQEMQYKYIQYKSEAGNSNSISNDWIISMCEDSEGYLWIGTQAGLNKFDPAEEKFLRYEKNDGLPSGNICGIVIDNDEIYQKQQAIKELGGKLDWRQDLQSVRFKSEETADDKDSLIEWVSESPYFAKRIFYKYAVIVFPLITIATLILSILSFIPLNFFLLSAIINFAIVGLNVRRINAIHGKVSRKFEMLKKYASILRMIDEEEFKARK